MAIYDRTYARDDERHGRLGGKARVLSVNMWLIIINTGIFVLQGVGPAFRVWTQMRGPLSLHDVFGVGKSGYLTLEVWRLLTFQFMHGGLTHLFFNMLGLWVFGGIVEEYLGRKKFLAFYLVCGIFGGLTYLLLNLLGQASHSLGMNIPVVLVNDPHAQLVGASAGVFGVIMACAFIAPNTMVQLIFPPVPLKMRTMAYAYVAIAAFNLLISGKNAGGDAAHVGGAIAGYFFIRRSHLLRDFFDVFKDSRKEGSKRAAPRSAKPAAVSASDAEIDRILAKVKDRGIHTLTDAERRTLARETEAKRNAG